MGFILQGIFGLALLAGIAWLMLYLATRKKEAVRWTREDREAERERLLTVPGEILYCAACQKRFDGPLPDPGCPHCHCAAFVVPDRLRGAPNEGGEGQSVGERAR
ncbi:MAG: hypothetical protein H7Z41_01410 [Cytophagales bacterium]|nr:hypothetical protein [Armatimonadota bacterium]